MLKNANGGYLHENIKLRFTEYRLCIQRRPFRTKRRNHLFQPDEHFQRRKRLKPVYCIRTRRGAGFPCRKDQKYASVYQNMFQIVEDVCKDDNLKQLAKEVDVIFTATPQGFLAGVLDEEILSNTKVIDLSADFRIKDVATYEKCMPTIITRMWWLRLK